MPRLVFGLLLMAFGVLFFLDTFGWIEFGRLARFWPVIFIILGISKLVTPYQAWSGIVWITVGSGLLLHTLRIAPLHHLWPVVLVLVGFRVVLRALHPGSEAPSCGPPSGDRPNSEPAPGPGVASGNAVTLSVVAFLGGVERRLQACDLRGGSVLAFMGGSEVDLRGASLALPEVTVDVTAFWGGIEMRVPEDWRVEWRGVAFLGGFSDRTRTASSPSGVLIVTGMAIMGGVEIKN